MKKGPVCLFRKELKRRLFLPHYHTHNQMSHIDVQPDWKRTLLSWVVAYSLWM